MDILALHRDLARHTEWADARIWSAIAPSSQAQTDSIVLDRLRHIHLVQNAFLSVWQSRPVDQSATGALEAPALLAFAQQVHRQIAGAMASSSPADLDRLVDLPWAALVSQHLGFDIAPPSLAETLLQVSAHSSYHRGQVNARLRELSVEPPMTDFIAWVWSRRPAPEWPTSPS